MSEYPLSDSAEEVRRASDNEVVGHTGLAVLTQPWWFEQDGDWSECVLQGAGPGFVRIQPSL